MAKVIICQGLPASGKSTWARAFVAKNHYYKRINKDDLRAMLDDGHWTKNNEKFILQARDALIISALSEGHSVIVDDTNLHPKHIPAIRQLVKEVAENGGVRAQVEVKFFDVSVDEAIERDLKRADSVGEKVIRDMYARYIVEPPELYDPPTGTWHVLVDMDGTLALMDGRSPFEWHRVGEDNPNFPVVWLIQHLARKYPIIVVSGRDAVCRQQTMDWLADWDIPYNALYMRSEGDNRDDTIVKREIFDAHIRDCCPVLFVLDDRDRVVKMWRQMGLTCFQVAEGNF